jgi:hypothetical protein
MLESKWWDSATRSDWTPLMLASMRGHAKTVSCLCAARAEIGYANGAGWDALWVAANDGRSEVVDVLLDAGAGDLAGRRDNQGVTPLMAASQSGQTGTMHILLEYELNARARRRAEEQRQRLEQGAGSDDDEYGEDKTMTDPTMLVTLRTVLLAGLLKSDPVTIESAIALGADARFHDQFGCSPGQHALQHDACSHLILRRLARAGTDLFGERTMPGVAVLQALEARLAILRRREDADHLRHFVRDLKVSVTAMLDGQPVWIQRIVDEAFGANFSWVMREDLETNAVARSMQSAISKLRELPRTG